MDSEFCWLSDVNWLRTVRFVGWVLWTAMDSVFCWLSNVNWLWTVSFVGWVMWTGYGQCVERTAYKLQDIGSWMTLGVQYINWPAMSHNLTMPNFSLQCFLESKVLTNHPQTTKGLINQLNCEVTRITNGYWWQQMMQTLNRWLPQHYTITDSERLTMDSEMHKFTKLITFFIISANYWGPCSNIFQNTWSQQQTL